MAIKGKRRSRGRGRRAVTAAPRPFLVPPKTPLGRRPSFHAVVGLVVAGALFGFLAALRASRVQAAAQSEVSEFQALVQSAVGGVAQPAPGTAGVLVLPQLGQNIGTLQQGKIPDGAARQARDWVKLLHRAAQNVARLEPARADLREARNEIARGLRLYEGLARAYGVAIEVGGDARKDLVAFLNDQLVVAAEVFDAGWNGLTTVLQKVGLPITPNAPPGPGGVPGAPGFPVPPGGQPPVTPGA